MTTKTQHKMESLTKTSMIGLMLLLNACASSDDLEAERMAQMHDIAMDVATPLQLRLDDAEYRIHELEQQLAMIR